jgi:transcriptional regulator with PAS, ATPase and Fis domain
MSDASTLSISSQARSMHVRSAAIKIIKGPDSGATAKMDQPSFVLGTGERADLRLTDPSVSREHVKFFLEQHGVRVVDEGSKNGTFVAGARIRNVLLTQDVTLTLGQTQIAVNIDADGLELALSGSDRFGSAIGSTAAMRHVFATLERAAATELTILLEGESGVGKDLLARAIHEKSSRNAGPMMVLDCGAIPPNLIESELFGHERGAFTGADQARRGVFEEADGGTLFLDEIGELPLDMQPKLLRALESREIRPVGGRASKPINVRVLAATNRRLAEAARLNEFRSDLFYRLAVVRVTVPPLRERSDDILPIARNMLRNLTRDLTADFPSNFAAMLTSYAWPGNVRELRNVVERFTVFGATAEGLFDKSASKVRPPDDELSSLSYHEARRIVLERFEEAYFPAVLEKANGVMARAAELAGVARPSFYRMLERVPGARTGGTEGS